MCSVPTKAPLKQWLCPKQATTLLLPQKLALLFVCSKLEKLNKMLTLWLFRKCVEAQLMRTFTHLSSTTVIFHPTLLVHLTVSLSISLSLRLLRKVKEVKRIHKAMFCKEFSAIMNRDHLLL